MSDTVLPPPDPEFEGSIGDTFAESTQHWPDPTRPPEGAPNIVTILFDDLGFGHLSCFGGPIEAPTISRLAENGLRYRNFHTTSLCSPSRASLLTGRDHHAVGFSLIAELATGFPAHNGLLPKSARTVAEVLRQHGYSTYCTGKWHLTPSAEAAASGPFDRWPLGCGFERFYGFIPGETDHWHPMLTVDNHRIPTPDHDGYHLSEDLVDQAIRMIRDQQQVASGRPFFLYLPFGATHSPFHVPKEYIEKYRGRFDAGWDVIRRETFERQKELGIVPADNDLPPRNPGIEPWDDLDDDAKAVYCRLMETFAGMADHADEQIGRLVDALTEMGVLDDTLLMVTSDNGAAQGNRHGTLNTERFRNLQEMSVEEMLPRLDDIGGPDTDPHYPSGWAMAGNAPFRRGKRDTHRGGNTDPLVVHWPSRIPDPGALRDQYLHIEDLYPTLLDVAGLPVPTRVDGVEQQPLHGHSMAPTFTDAAAPEVRTTQYFEMIGSRAIYEDGWMAVTWHRGGTDWNDDQWELYDQRVDYTQAHDLAEVEPDRLAHLIERWWEEARARGVLPLDDRGFERALDPARPSAAEDREVYHYYPDTSPVPRQAVPRAMRGSFSLRAHLTLEQPDDAGYVIGCGGNLAGWALIVRDRHVTYVDNCLQTTVSRLTTPDPLPVGQEVAVTLDWAAEGHGKGTAALSVNGTEVARAEGIPHGRSSPVQEGVQVGRSWAPSVDPTLFTAPFDFTGTLRVVELRSTDTADT